MGLCGDKIKRLRQLPDTHFFMFVGAKVLGGLGLGILLATWLPGWTWWVFIVIALVLAIPVFRLLFKK